MSDQCRNCSNRGVEAKLCNTEGYPCSIPDSWYHLAAMEEKDRVIAELKKMAKMFHCEIHDFGSMIHNYCPFCKLSHLTAALNDDERAERVAGVKSYMSRQYAEGRTKGINDYREMLKGEVKK